MHSTENHRIKDKIKGRPHNKGELNRAQSTAYRAQGCAVLKISVGPDDQHVLAAGTFMHLGVEHGMDAGTCAKPPLSLPFSMAPRTLSGAFTLDPSLSG